MPVSVFLQARVFKTAWREELLEPVFLQVVEYISDYSAAVSPELPAPVEVVKESMNAVALNEVFSDCQSEFIKVKLVSRREPFHIEETRVKKTSILWITM